MNTKIIEKHSELEEVINNCEVCYVSMVDKDGKPITKVALPAWSAAASESDMDEEEPIPEELSTEDLLEE